MYMSVGIERSTTSTYINGDDPETVSTAKRVHEYFRSNREANNETAIPLPSKNFTLNEQRLNYSLNKLLNNPNSTPSPSRAMCDLFWINIDWQELKKTLGEINILDLGCGNGNYFKKISEWSNNSISSYTGIDLQESSKWKNYKNASFLKLDIDKNIDNLESFFPEKRNFFMSQSALEHIKYDLEIFAQIKKYILKNKKPVTQIHLVPAPESLNLYGPHGYRQYGEKALNKIINLFKDFCDIKIFNLGSEKCNTLHFNYITNPVYFLKTNDKRNTHPAEYIEQLKTSIKEDMKTNSTNLACFRALEINYK